MMERGSMIERDILIPAIDRVRRKLNFRIVFGAVLGVFPYLCAGAAAVLFIWRLASALGLLPGALWFSRGMALPALIGICAAGIPVLAFLQRRKRLDRDRAAQWLDGRLASRGVLSAALACLERDETGDFPDRIFAGAAEALKAEKNLGGKLFPRRILIRRAFIASVSLAAGIILISVWNPLSASLALRAEDEKKADLESAVGKNPQNDGDEKLSDQEEARRLFPGDSRLEALAEQALRNKDREALAFLMKESGLNPEDMRQRLGDAEQGETPLSAQDSPESGTGRDGALGTTPEEQREQTPGESSAQKGSDAGQGGKKEQDGQKAAGAADKKNRKDGSRGVGEKAAGEKKAGETPGENEGEAGSAKEEGSAGSRSSADNSEGGGGQKAGNGAASETAGLKQKNVKTGEDAVIKYRDKGSPIEFVMPGKKSAQTLTQVIPDARRSAEEAMGRSSTPLEYEAFVKSYFTALSKESKQ